MKKSTLRNLGVMAVVLCLVTTSLLGGTLAKYTSKVTGNAKATVAAWKFSANGLGEAESTLNLAETTVAKDGIAANVIAPGTKGTFTISLDGDGSDVGIDYTITIGAESVKMPTGFKYTAKVGGKDITPEDDGSLAGKIYYSATSGDMKQDVEITWEWPDNGDNTDNSYLTSLGDNLSLTIPITVNATQMAPSETKPSV